MKKYIFVLFMALGMVFFESIAVAEQDMPDETWGKLKEIRKQMNDAKYESEQAKQKICKECDKNICAAKEEFHKTRDKCLKDKQNSLDDLNRDFKAKVGPMEAKEKELLEKVRPAQADFVKKRKK